YYQNGELKYISSVSPTLPLVADVSFYHTGATISDVMVSNYTTGSFTATATNAGADPSYQWVLNGLNVGTNSPTYSNSALSDGDSLICILNPDLGGCSTLNYTSNRIGIKENDTPSSINFYISADTTLNACQASEEEVLWDITVLSNVEATGNNLLKIQDNNWNGDAVSLNEVYNNGSVQFTTLETNLSRAIGLSTVNSGAGLNTIDYAFYLRNDGNFFVFENNANRYSGGSYNTGDIFKIEIRENVVYYFRNDNLLYISNVIPTLPMIVDVSMYHVGSTLEEVTITNFSEGVYYASVTNAGANPVFQWKLNGSNVGSNSSTYTNLNVADGDILSCELIPDLS
ncbi:MAG: hypothetical protein ACP5E3_16105, partial [Bacteroidales bacterium]